jgi:hypothetical protein
VSARTTVRLLTVVLALAAGGCGAGGPAPGAVQGMVPM